jgi:hypothetical protein
MAQIAKITVNDSETRWELMLVNIENESFTVLDKLVKRRRAYHVPFLMHAEIVGQAVYIFTSNSKVMELNLSTASRQFLSISQLRDLKKIQETHHSLQIKKNAVTKHTHTLTNIAHLPTYAFSNTISAY